MSKLIWRILFFTVMISKCICEDQFIMTDDTKVLSILNEVVYSAIDSKYGNSFIQRVQNKLIEIQRIYPETQAILLDIKVQSANKYFTYFINNKTMKVYLVVRGTAGISDYGSDFNLFQGDIPERVELINEFAKNQMLHDYQNGYETTISGHSLGGSLSIFVCIQNKWIDNCEVHNPYLNSNILETIEEYSKGQPNLKDHLLIQITKGDYVSRLTQEEYERLPSRVSFFQKGDISLFMNPHASLTLLGQAALQGNIKYQFQVQNIFNQSQEIHRITDIQLYYNCQIMKGFCVLCPFNQSCKDALTGPYKCLPGQFLNNKGECEICPIGTYSIQFGGLKCKPCPEGYTCKDPSHPPSICPFGQVNYDVGNTECFQCNEGFYYYYSFKYDIYQCLSCPIGHFCESGKPVACPPGYISNGQQAKCNQCEVGYYQSKSGQLFCLLCPPGYSCENSAQEPVLCPPGSISSGLQITCEICQEGYYQTESGQFYCLECPPGYSCQDPASEPIPCPPGFVSSGLQVTCKPCGEGEYQNQKGQSFCLAIPDQKSVKCPTGSYSSYKLIPNVCYPCFRGYYQTQIGQHKCITCPLGHSCYDNEEEPVPCQPGSYANYELLLGQCYSCSRGYYQAKSGQNKCIKCPLGHSCLDNQKYPVPCPPGSYASHELIIGQCYPISRGYYQTQSGQNKQMICPRCHSCEDNSKDPVPCPPGQIANYNFLLGRCYSCEPGYYQPQSGQDDCIICPQGHSCEDPSVAIACPPGTAASNSFFYWKCYVCNYGYYQPQSGQIVCLQCPTGFSCKDPTLAVPCQIGETNC